MADHPDNKKLTGWAAYNAKKAAEKAKSATTGSSTTAKTTKKTKKQIQKALKKTHPLTIAICVFSCLVGIGLGAFFAYRFTKDDHFTLNGTASYSLDVGDQDYIYREEGCSVISLGRNLSEQITVSSNLTANEDGSYTIPTDQPGTYYIAYTIDDIKFGSIRRVRTFTVTAEEGDYDGEER